MSNDRDIMGVLVLNYRLNILKSKYNLSCLVTNNVSSKSRIFLEKNSIKIININFFENLEKMKIDKDKIDILYNKQTFGKLFIFLVNNKCIYLDSDLYINQNIDHLFEYNTSEKKIYMTNDLLMIKKNSDSDDSDDSWTLLNINNKFNSGLIILEGNENIFRDICNYIISTDIEVMNKWHSDQIILNVLYQNNTINVTTLDHKYNLIFNSTDFFIETKLINENDIYVVHYTLSNKPWLVESLNKSGGDYCKKYWLKWYKAYYDFQESNFNDSNLKYKNIICLNTK